MERERLVTVIAESMVATSPSTVDVYERLPAHRQRAWRERAEYIADRILDEYDHPTPREKRPTL